MTQGVIGAENEQELLAEAAKEAQRAIDELNRTSRKEPAEVAEAVRLAVRRVFRRRIETKPVVVPLVHESHYDLSIFDQCSFHESRLRASECSRCVKGKAQTTLRFDWEQRHPKPKLRVFPIEWKQDS